MEAFSRGRLGGQLGHVKGVGLGGFVLFLGLLWGAVAAAEEEIRLITGATGGLQPDGPLPAGQPFRVRVPVEDGLQAEARLWIWPEAEEKDEQGSCGNDPGPGARQRIEIAMGAEGPLGNRVLVGRAPRLQIGQAYCFRLQVEEVVEPRLLAALAAGAAPRVVAGLEAAWRRGEPVDCERLHVGDPPRDPMLIGIREAHQIARYPFQPDEDAWRGFADQLGVAWQINGGPTQCLALVQALEQNRLDESMLEEARRSGGAERLRDAVLAARESTELVGASIAAMEAEIRRVVASPGMSERLRERPLTWYTPQRSGGAEVVEVGHFASPEAGLSLAVPLASEEGPWLLPHAGVQLFFVPVDRSFRMNQLVGSPGERLLQRFSLSAGAVLAPPQRTEVPVVGIAGTKGLLPSGGVGLRVSQFASIHSGVVFFQRLPPGQNAELGMAWTIGLSLGADVLALLEHSLSSRR